MNLLYIYLACTFEGLLCSQNTKCKPQRHKFEDCRMATRSMRYNVPLVLAESLTWTGLLRELLKDLLEWNASSNQLNRRRGSIVK